MSARRMRTRVPGEGTCGLCGHEGLDLESSRNRRRGLAWVNPWWDAEERSYRVCTGCGARNRLIDGREI